MTRLWAAMAVAGVAAAALLGGCAEKQEASQTLPGTSSAPTTSEQAPPPLGPPDLPMPDETRTKDEAGAEAFVRYYIALINRTSDVMDAAPLREFSNGCRECHRLAANTEEDAAAGNDYAGGHITITRFGEPLLKGTTAELAIRIDQAAFEVSDADGSPVPGGSEPLVDVPGGVALAWDSARRTWMMTDLTFG